MTKQYLLEKLVVDKLGDFERRMFDSQAQALCWLAECGFELDPATTIEKF